jgi:hypothetical protein
MTAKAEPEPKPSPAEPDFSKFADRDFTEGAELDADQEWIGELLAERVRRIDKSYTLEETMQWLEEYKREYRRKKS